MRSVLYKILFSKQNLSFISKTHIRINTPSQSTAMRCSQEPSDPFCRAKGGLLVLQPTGYRAPGPWCEGPEGKQPMSNLDIVVALRKAFLWPDT